MSLRRPAGFVFDDRGEAGETRQCVHCGKHWHSSLRVKLPHEPKVVRGFCMNCNGHVCGDPGCIDCVAAEAKLEIIEGTRNPTAVSVPVSLPGKLWLS
jgi:hypothetical protein